MAHSASTATRSYRSNLDLVASDEMLSALLRGLSRLRIELEVTRRNAEKAAANSATSGTRSPLLTSTAQSSDQRCWYYAAEDVSLTTVPPRTAATESAVSAP